MKDLRPLIPYFARYKKYLFFGVLFILLSNIFSIVIPPIVRETIDSVIAVGTNSSGQSLIDRFPDYFQDSYQRIALFAGLLILGSAILKGVFMFFMRQTIIVMSRYIEFDLKNTIFKKYQNLDQGFYGANYTGDLMNRITEDVSKVRSFTGPAIMYSINLSLMIVIIVSVMLYINPKITLVVLIPLPMLALIIYKVSSAMNIQSDRIQRKLSGITSFAQETFSGIHVLKSFAVEKDFSRDFDKESEEFKNENMKLVKINAVFMPTVLGIVGLSILLTLFMGGREVAAGNFSQGNIVEFVIYVTMLTWPVASLGYVTSLVQQGAASMKRINEFLDTPAESDEGSVELSSFSDSIEFKNVSFAYPNTDKLVLKNVSFTLKKGQKLGIIGTTGSGKSTIAKLLMCVYEPNEGAILIDGKNIQAYTKDSVRSQFGYVAQDIFLFSESIRDNVTFGSTKAVTEADLLDALDRAAMTEEIHGFKDGLETILGERGITLSGGQKQRTAIARALIRKPEILLIDDGLSAVDTKTEVHIKSGIKSQVKGSTFINISHRISSVQDADQIICLHEGEIIEEGNHDKLVLEQGVYADLYTKQMVQEETV